MNPDLAAQKHLLAVISDIHGNLPAFEAVMAALNAFAPIERILVAGDIIGGPHDDAILRRLRDLDAVMIVGNNECAIVDLEQGTAPEYHYAAQQFSVWRWSWQHLSPEMLALVCALPQQTTFNLPGCDPICMVHGSPRDVWEGTSPHEKRAAFDEILGLMGAPVAVFGHTHRAWCVREQGRLAINPGAVSIPEGDYLEGGAFRPGPAGARFAILEWDGQQWNPQFHFIRYDLGALRRAYAETGFLHEAGLLARVFLLDALTGQPVWIDFFNLADRLAEAAGAGSLPYIPDEVWQRVGDQFDWEKWEAVAMPLISGD